MTELSSELYRNIQSYLKKLNVTADSEVLGALRNLTFVAADNLNSRGRPPSAGERKNAELIFEILIDRALKGNAEIVQSDMNGNASLSISDLNKIKDVLCPIYPIC